MTTQLNTNLTGPELYVGDNPFARNFLGFRRGWNDPWQDEKNQRRLAKIMFGALGGGGLLSLGFKAQDLLDPHGWDRPFHKSEEAKEKEKQADIESRDDTPAITRERKRLYAIAMRLNRAADWARLRSFDKYA